MFPRCNEYHRPLIAAMLPLILGCPSGSPAPEPSELRIALEVVAEGFASPVALAEPGDGSGRLFVVDQIGRIHRIDADGTVIVEPFLDVTDRMVSLSSSFDERGLLGLAFHPDFATNSRFFVYYSAPLDDDDPDGFSLKNRVSEFTVSATDADVADPQSERVILEILKPQANHNGGQLAFGPDGFLYIGTGDGGGANDTSSGHTPGLGNGQDRSTLLGKILRIDVDSGDPYAVPEDNPFVDDPNARPEIWALGLRNPWRFSFDSGGDHELFAGDVGQGRIEEVDIIGRGGNYGWNIKEGSTCFNTSNASAVLAECADTDANGEPLIDPILEYDQRDAVGLPVGTSVIGGYVYRGSAIPDLAGRYVFGDYSAGFIAPDGTLFVGSREDDDAWSLRELTIASTTSGRIGAFVLAFGQDAEGELYVLTSQRGGPSGSTGRVHKIIPAD